jgi:hypothetical protein
LRIGVVSDTHDQMRNVARIVELLNAARVDRVIHTGDITQPKTLHALARLEAPLLGVYGNNDRMRYELETAAARHAHTFVDPPLRLELAGRRIVVVHDPYDLELEARLASGSDLVLHGHNHRYIAEHRHGALVFNPGECAGWLTGHNAVGVVDLVRLETERLFF